MTGINSLPNCDSLRIGKFVEGISKRTTNLTSVLLRVWTPLADEVQTLQDSPSWNVERTKMRAFYSSHIKTFFQFSVELLYPRDDLKALVSHSSEPCKAWEGVIGYCRQWELGSNYELVKL